MEPLSGNGRLALTPIFRLSGRVYRGLLNNRPFQLVVPDACQLSVTNAMDLQAQY
jgi:hypothetical protein